ncbi:MAG: hypothetical protein J3Q66DRAFT_326486 [Benniella sp.]|nr:MAG: hypothetical protein J3Q66DRAFT_326486 [Benniella sp.]
MTLSSFFALRWKSIFQLVVFSSVLPLIIPLLPIPPTPAADIVCILCFFQSLFPPLPLALPYLFSRSAVLKRLASGQSRTTRYLEDPEYPLPALPLSIHCTCNA